MAFTFEDWQAKKPIPKGWDVADAERDGWTWKDIEAFMRATVRVWSPPELPPREVYDEPPAPSRSTVREARTTQQEQPQAATVTQIHTRKTVRADDSWMLDLVCNGEGHTKPGVMKNWAMFLEHHPDMAGVFAFDAFKLRVVLNRRPPWEAESSAPWTPRTLQDRDCNEAVMWLEAKHMTPKPTSVLPAIQSVAERYSFDRLREYLDGLEWDRKPRVATWLSYYIGVEDSPYARTVALRWLVSSVARGLGPGCKVDTMPILEGPQGARKSSVLRALYGNEFFTDELSDIGSKDAKMEMQGVWGLEVAEMQRLNAAETSAVKKFMGVQVDRYRPPYGRQTIDAPRRVVLLGTINPEGNAYLKDPTGARRFWPVTVGRIDLDAIAEDRDQIWAEAVELYRAGTPWWVQEAEQEAVEAEQEKRTEVDVWTAQIAPMIRSRTEITQWEVFENLGIAKRDADYRHAARVGRIMRKFGWQSIRDRRGGEDQTMYRDPRANWATQPGDDAVEW